MATLSTLGSKTFSSLDSSMIDWTSTFKETYDKAVRRYEDGHRGPTNIVSADDLEFLSSIGMTAQELYDFIEDWVEDGEPPFDTVLRISSVRRDYFLNVQKGQPSGKALSMSTLPSGHEQLGGYRWLPRIIAKAQAKLRGEMPSDLMYGCGADRPFLRRLGIDPADFLRKVWETEGHHQPILDYVNNRDPKL